MPTTEFVIADVAIHRSELMALNIEYMQWAFQGIETHFKVLANDVVGMRVSEYVLTMIDKVCGDPPPKGIFYLVTVDGALAGMGGIRFLREGVAEVKRIYFRTAYRGNKLGERMLARLMADAKSFGYQRICLDSGPFMVAAHKVYERCDFADCAAYEGTEVPEQFRSGWRFMQRDL